MNDYKIYPCGCSNLIVTLGKCTQYDEKGEPHADTTAKQYMCHSAILNMASQFATRSYNAQLAADKLRNNDASSFAEHEVIATTWSYAGALLSELAGGEPSEVEPLHPIIVGEMLWAFMNERRCKLIKKDVYEKGLSPENKTELAELEAVLDARCTLITALERLTPKGLDALTTAFADAVCNHQTPLDVVTHGALVDAIQDLSRKKLLGRLTYAEEALLARCINRLGRDPMRESFVPNVPANECSNAERTQYELTIEQQKAKIAGLERECMRLWSIQADEAKLANEQIDRADAAENRVTELEARLSEFANPPVVDATPTTGKVFPGLSFERELADGSREKLDPARMRFTIADEDHGQTYLPVGFVEKP